MLLDKSQKIKKKDPMAWTAQSWALLIHSRLLKANFPIVLTPSQQYLLLFWWEKKQDAPTSWKKKKKRQDFLSIFEIVCRLVSVRLFIPKLTVCWRKSGTAEPLCFQVLRWPQSADLFSHFWNTFWQLTESMTTEQEVCPIHQGLNVKRGGGEREPSNDRKGRRGVGFFGFTHEHFLTNSGRESGNKDSSQNSPSPSF